VLLWRERRNKALSFIGGGQYEEDKRSETKGSEGKDSETKGSERKSSKNKSSKTKGSERKNSEGKGSEGKTKKRKEKTQFIRLYAFGFPFAAGDFGCDCQCYFVSGYIE
jgi:hypothetical protein